MSTKPIHPAPARRQKRALDLLQQMSAVQPSQLPSPKPELQPPISPPARPTKRRRNLPPTEVIEILDSDEIEPEIIDISYSDEGESAASPPGPMDIDLPDQIFNTNHLLHTRQTVRNWLADHDPDAWILSREEFHAHQVDRDRSLPANLDDFPSSYVSPTYFFLMSNSLYQAGYLRQRSGVHAPISHGPL